ncbi:MAG: hypothetical protein KDA37_16775 [Planctomycetales bacterium]|nr:hypothetical protein [Planctomycetales bacterium]
MRHVIAALAILVVSVLATRAAATRIHFEGEFSALENGISWNLPSDEGFTGYYVIRDEHPFEYNDDSVSFSSRLITDFEVTGDSGWGLRANQGLASTANWVSALNDLSSGPVTIRTVEIGAVEAGTRHLLAPIILTPGDGFIDIDGDGTPGDNFGTGILGPPPTGQVHYPSPLEILDSPTFVVIGSPNLELIATPAPIVPEPLFRINLGRAAPGTFDMADITAILYLPDPNGVRRSVFFRITEITTIPEPGGVSLLGGLCSLALAAATRRSRCGRSS